MTFHRRYTLVFIPRNENGAKELRGPFFLGCALLLAFIITLIIWSVSSTYMASYFEVGNLAHLERENRNLAIRIQDLHQRTERYQKQMKGLTHREKEARIIAGLPDIHPDIRKLGIGGDGQPFISEMDTDSLMTLTYRIDTDLNQLLREVQLEQASLTSIKEKVEQDKKYWHHMPTVRPVDGRTTSNFGVRNDPITGLRRMHSGVDIAARRGENVRATAAGMVVYTGLGRNYGRFVDIDHQNGYITRYGHLSQITIQENTQVKRGDIIGLVGDTGRATGYHLHYEIRRNNRATDPSSHFFPEKSVVD